MGIYPVYHIQLLTLTVTNSRQSHQSHEFHHFRVGCLSLPVGQWIRGEAAALPFQSRGLVAQWNRFPGWLENGAWFQELVEGLRRVEMLMCCVVFYYINLYKLTWSVRCYIHIDNTAWGMGSSFLLWPTERQSLPSNHSTRKKFRVDIEFVHVGFHMWGWRLGLLR